VEQSDSEKVGLDSVVSTVDRNHNSAQVAADINIDSSSQVSKKPRQLSPLGQGDKRVPNQRTFYSPSDMQQIHQMDMFAARELRAQRAAERQVILFFKINLQQFPQPRLNDKEEEDEEDGEELKRKQTGGTRRNVG
jgi:hypothetical protein